MQENVEFGSGGQTLRGNIDIPAAGAACVILSHGLEGDKDSRKWKLIAGCLHGLGLASLRFNYHGCGRGRGKSGGRFADSLLSQRVEDFKAALDFLRTQNVDTGRLGVVSSSLGGTVVLAARDPRIRAVACLATPFAFPRPLEQHMSRYSGNEYASLPSGRRVRTGFFHELWGLDSGRDMAAFEGPVLLVHGSSDRVVPVSDAGRLYESANRPKKLEVIEGADHSFSSPAHLKRAAELACRWLEYYL